MKQIVLFISLLSVSVFSQSLQTVDTSNVSSTEDVAEVQSNEVASSQPAIESTVPAPEVQSNTIAPTVVTTQSVNTNNVATNENKSSDTIYTRGATTTNTASVANSQPTKSEKDSVVTIKNPKSKKQVSPLFNFGVQFYNSANNTSAMTINLEAGARIKRNKFFSTQHTVEGYWAISKWETSEYDLGDIWGVNYNYMALMKFGKSLRLDLGVLAGYNIYEEQNRYTQDLYKTVTFGGPKGQVNIRLGKLGIGVGYTALLGYREYNGDRVSTHIDQWNVVFGVSI